MAGLSAACSEFESMGGRTKQEWSLEYLLSWVASKVDADGWVSRSVARECLKEATVDKVVWLISPLHPMASSEERQQWKADGERLKPTDAHKAEAVAAIEWASKLQPKEEEDYLANLNTVARIGTVERKTIGIGGSMITAYRRAMEWEVKREEFAKRDARPAGVHVGTVGKRIKSMKLTCEKIIELNGAYGITGMHKFIDEAGNELVWFASGSAGWFNEGETAEAAATVKSHGEYKGRPQTVLNRVAKK